MNTELEKLKILIRSIGYCSNPSFRLERSKEALRIVESLEARLLAPTPSPLAQAAEDFDNDYKYGD